MVDQGLDEATRAIAADRRDFAADARDDKASERDSAADLRDAIADERDRIADERERELDEREERLATRSDELGMVPVETAAEVERAKAWRAQATTLREAANLARHDRKIERDLEEDARRNLRRRSEEDAGAIPEPSPADGGPPSPP